MRVRVLSGSRGWLRSANETVVTWTSARLAISARVTRRGQTIRAVGQGVDDPERPQTLWGLWSESIVSIGGALRGYHSRQFIVVPAGDSPLPNLLLTQ